MSFEQDLSQIEKPTRYLGGELNSITKDLSTVDLRFALAFPDTYEVGMSHVGSAILYHVLNDQEWIAAERVYAPWPDMEAYLRENSQPLASLENHLPLGEFDVVGFTLQYELSYSNILNMMNLAGIPLRRTDRTDAHPLIIAGGPCAYNPEPISDFIDCVLIGDGEEATIEICTAIRDSKQLGESRTALLDRLSRIVGVYIPSLFDVSYNDDGTIKAITPQRADYPKVTRRYLENLDSAPFPTKPIVPFMNTVHNRVSMEIARGCTRGCRFCQAGYVYRPVRERSPQTIADLLEKSLASSGFDEATLLSLSTGDYSCIEPLLKGLMGRYADKKVAIALPSLRVGSLTEESMEQIKKVRKTGFTLAPEAGSERLRQVINKGISEEDLLEATHNAYSLGWRVIKLYFMLGLPTETDADLDALIDLAGRVKRSGKGTGGADANASVSTFVPKPHTPFQWEAQIDEIETRRRQSILRTGLAKKKVRFKWHDAPLSLMEGVFSRGDRRLGAVIERAVELGCRFDGWREHFRYDLWKQAMADCGLDPLWYLRERQLDEILPWHHIDAGLDKDFLLRELHFSKTEQATGDCRTEPCTNCGVCNFKSLRMRLTDADEITTLPNQSAQTEDDPRVRYRLRLRKDGRARLVSHLEYINVLERAARRAEIPLRYSQGFHPSPKFSFSDALPTGVASDAELIDIELFRSLTTTELMQSLNEQLPEGFKIFDCQTIDPKSPSPSASIDYAVYRVELPTVPNGLAERLQTFLQCEQVMAEVLRKGNLKSEDLRPDVVDLQLDENELLVSLRKGGPYRLLTWLLESDDAAVRRLTVRKISVSLKPVPDKDQTDETND
jgi:radical SAM family uncharacterized protein/radical SAM-linked protein